MMHNSIEVPCNKDCPNRRQGCHSICNAYKEFDRQNRIANEEKRRQKDLDYWIPKG